MQLKKWKVTSVVVSLQTAGSRRNGDTMCQSSAGVSTPSWRLARGPSGSGTSTSCTWWSCGRWPKPCPSSSGRPSSCTPAERWRTGDTSSCCWRSCTRPSGSARTESRTASCSFQSLITGHCSASRLSDPSHCTLTRRRCLPATRWRPLNWRWEHLESLHHWRFLKAQSDSNTFASAVGVTPGGLQADLPQHLQDHGLRGLLQVSAVGETAGEQRRWTHDFLSFGFQAAVSVLLAFALISISLISPSSPDPGIRNITEDFVFTATDWGFSRVRRPAATQIPLQPPGDRLAAQCLWKVRWSAGVALSFYLPLVYNYCILLSSCLFPRWSLH